MSIKATKGFTLLELLIVIAILAVLTTVVILVLNPGEYLAQARDSQRISDLSTLNSAIALYLSSTATISMGTCNAPTTVYCTNTGSVGASSCTSITSSTIVTGAGWVPIAFSGLPGGSPIAREPVDPTNSTTYKYGYGCASADNTYELDALMESAKYKAGGINDLGGNDGGNSSSTYEIGTKLTIL